MPISQGVATELAAYVHDNGGLGVTLLDISAQSDWGSYILIASFTSGRQALGLMALACTWLRERDFQIKVSDQSPESTWFLCDAGDIVLHFFTQEMRQYYALESLWKSGQIIYTAPL